LDPDTPADWWFQFKVNSAEEPTLKHNKGILVAGKIAPWRAPSLRHVSGRIATLFGMVSSMAILATAAVAVGTFQGDAGQHILLSGFWLSSSDSYEMIQKSNRRRGEVGRIELD